MTSSTQLARLVVDELVRHGVREAVLSPGSRSAPLALALHAADAAGRLRLHVRIDERTAGFLALGLARGARTPVPVVTTSGSAVAHLHPAVLEAHHSGVPLVVVSADRPAELRGTGANQTTDQARLFGGAVRLHADIPAGSAPPSAWRALVARAVVAATGALSADPGPVQLNCQLADPLLPGSDDPEGRPDVPAGADGAGRADRTDGPGRADWTGRAGGSVAAGPAEEPGSGHTGRPHGAPWTRAPAPARPEPVDLPPGPRTVVVAGADSGPPARVLAERAGWPLLAEPSSGARTGTAALRSYRLLLAHLPLAAQVERVVVYGHPTLSRSVTRLLTRADVEVLVCASRQPWPDVGHRASAVLPAVTAPATTGDADGWSARWAAADAAVSSAVDAELRSARSRLPADTMLGQEVARAVAEALPARGLLVVGGSQPVRDLDLMTAPPPVGERRLVLANRGLSGIDGTVSTAIGAALARSSARALAYVGDLTFLHDQAGLLMRRGEPRPDLTVVVADDAGGSIFSVLEQGAPSYADAFERVFATPPDVDLAALCAATSTPHRRVGSPDELRRALAEPAGGVEVVVAGVDRAGRRALDERLAAVAESALREVLDE